MKKSKLFAVVLIVLCLTVSASLSVFTSEAKSTNSKLTYSNLYDKSTKDNTAKQMEQGYEVFHQIRAVLLFDEPSGCR